jgi:hypothetical protein
MVILISQLLVAMSDILRVLMLLVFSALNAITVTAAEDVSKGEFQLVYVNFVWVSGKL